MTGDRFATDEAGEAAVELAAAFAARHIRPVAAQYDQAEEVPWDVMRLAAQSGLMGFSLPERYGGGGISDGITRMRVIEELAWGCAGIATCITGSALAGEVIVRLGTDEQKERFLPVLTGSTPRLAALCLTEPDAGSDIGAITTTAVNTGDGYYLLSGTKTLITGGGIADLHVIFARASGPDRTGEPVMSVFVAEPDTPGLTMGKKEKKLGVRASHTAEVVLDNCRIPSGNRLGGDRSLPLVAMRVLDAMRPGAGAAAIGVARAALEYAVQYAKTRRQFGVPIIEHQAVALKLADMATRITAARLLVHHAARLSDSRRGCRLAEGNMAKLFAGDVAVFATQEALQILGGYGYLADYPVEKWVRDARVYQIWEGTGEIQRLIVARTLAARLSPRGE